MPTLYGAHGPKSLKSRSTGILRLGCSAGVYNGRVRRIFSEEASIQRLIAMARNSPFLKHNLIFFLGSLGVSALNYLYYPVLGRLMPPSHFGEVQALMTLYVQAATFLNILAFITVHVTVNNRNENERNLVLAGLERIAIIFGGGMLTLALLSVSWLRSFLNFEEVWPFVMLAVTLAASIPLALRMAFLRGSKAFARASITDGVGSFAKLMFSPLLVVIGWKTFGAVTGLALSQVISLWLVIGWSRTAGFNGFGLTSKAASLKKLKPQLSYGAVVFLASSSVTAMLGLDILAVKHYFPSTEAGLYAGVATVGRIVYFLTAPFIAVLVSSVSVRQSVQKNYLQLRGCIGLILVLGSATVLFMKLFPELTIRLLVGSKYLAHAQYLPWLALAMLMLALANALLMYRVALRQYRFVVPPLLVLALMVTLLYFRHTNIFEIISLVLTGSTSMLLAIVLQGFAEKLTPKAAHG
jgi:O-antigen/teichoic acid export membrane protein